MNYDHHTVPNYLTEVLIENNLSVHYLISRQRIAEVLNTLFKHLDEIHKSGFVHCDLKPQNILCLENGLIPIDPIYVKAGEVSVGMTMGFCAPEQVLSIPTTISTDIYNLGLIILSLIDGVIFGKTSNYIIPTGANKVKQVNLFTESKIYIDHLNSNIKDKDGIPFWVAFLEKCLAFEQKNRFQDINTFEKEYNQLISKFPLINDIEFKPFFGELSFVYIDGLPKPAWIV